MTAEPVLAREFDLKINTGSLLAPVWTAISGITGITPGQSSQLTDDTDFDTDGWESGTVVQRGRSLSVAINYKEDPATGDRDGGQEALIALGDAMGPAAKKQFKYVSPSGKGSIFRATCDIQWPGGDKTANAAFTAELKVDGPPVPAPAPVPSITGLVPAGGGTAGGDAVTIVGTGFTGATAVTFGGGAATSVVVVNDTTITCVTPAHAAAAVDVVVTTPGGSDTLVGGFTYA